MRSAVLSKHFLVPLRVAFLSLPALGLIALTGFLFDLLLSWLRATVLGDSRTVFLSLICTLVTWLFISVFHTKTESITLSIPDHESFLNSLRTEMRLLGYVSVTGYDDLYFRPVFTAFVFGGSIRVRLGKGSCTLSGPKLFLEILRGRLRIDASAQQALSGYRLRHNRRLKRVQMSIRIADGQWASVHSAIVDALDREGIDLVCDLEVLAHSERGIPESAVESICARLNERQVQVSVHKETMTQPEPVLAG